MTDREEVLVYHFDRDLEQILHSIVNAWNRNKDYKQRWNMGPKDQVWANIKFQGGHLELRVEALKGGWRESNRYDLIEMARFAQEVQVCLKLAEADLRKEFKEKAGKAFRWSKGTVTSNYEPVALNSLYRFWAAKSGPVSVKIDRQEHSPGVEGPFKSKKEGPNDWQLVDSLSLPENWR